MSKTTRAMSADEKRWQAEDDARVMKRHAELQNDPNRVKEASKIISKELTSLQTVASNIGAVSTQKKASASKGTAKKSTGAKTATKASTPKKTTPAKTTKPATKQAPKTAPKQQTKKRGK